MSKKPFVDFIVNNLDNKIPKIFLKPMFKLGFIMSAEVDLSQLKDKGKEEYNKKEISEFEELLLDYHNRGYTVYETIQDFREQIDSYSALKVKGISALVFHTKMK